MLHTKSSSFLSKLAFNLLVAILPIVLVGCNNTGGSTTSTTSNSNPTTTAIRTNSDAMNKRSSMLNNNFQAVTMGSAYDDSTNTTTSGLSCLVAVDNMKNITMSNPTQLMTFDKEQNFATLQNILGINISGQYAGGMFAINSPMSQYAVDSQDNQYKTNIIYFYQYAGTSSFVPGSIGTGYNALNPVAAALAESQPTAFREVCGDEFVSQMNAGALIGVTLTVTFNTHMDQERFAAKFKGNVGLTGVGAAIQQAAANANVNVNLGMRAIQLGGNPQNLEKVYNHFVPFIDYPYVNCGSVNGPQTNKCAGLIDGIAAYSATIKDQIYNSDGSLNTNSLYLYSPIAVNYSTLGINVNAPNPESAVYAAMGTLTSGYNKSLYDYTFATHYLENLSGYLDGGTFETLQNAAARLKRQINVYGEPTNNIMDCYSGYVTNECLTIANNISHNLAILQLSPQESGLISYLESASYSARLYQYTGGAKPQPSSFILSPQECILAPISSPLDARYAINCNDKWLPATLTPPMGFATITMSGNGLAVNGLSYMSESTVNGVVYQQPVTYQNSNLYEDPSYFRYYNGTGINIMSGSITINANGDLNFIRWYENQA